MMWVCGCGCVGVGVGVGRAGWIKGILRGYAYVIRSGRRPSGSQRPGRTAVSALSTWVIVWPVVLTQPLRYMVHMSLNLLHIGVGFRLCLKWRSLDRIRTWCPMMLLSNSPNVGSPVEWVLQNHYNVWSGTIFAQRKLKVPSLFK